MAGDWIKWCKGLASRREVVVLASKLGRDRHEIAGRLMVLWEWCDDNVSETDIDPASLNVSLLLGDNPAAFVDALLGLPGMAEAMASPEVRWIEARSGGRLVFPNLARHNGTSAKTRAYDARKKQIQRGKNKPPPDNLPQELSPKSGDKTGTRKEQSIELIDNYQNQSINHNRGSPPETIPNGNSDPFRLIDISVLTDLEKLQGWCISAIAAGVIENTQSDRHSVVYAACHATRDDKRITNPVGLFRSIVQGKHWDRLTNRDEDAAKAKILEYNRKLAGRKAVPGGQHTLGETLSELKDELNATSKTTTPEPRS